MESSPSARIRLLGGFEIYDLDGVQIRIIGRRARGLMAMLCLEGRGGLLRDRICGLLWADRPDEQARGSLRQCLFELRSALGACADDILDVGRERVSIRPGSLLTDIDTLKVALHSDDQDKMAGTASQLASGPLLEGMDLSGPFQEWLDQARGAWEAALLDELTRRLASLEAASRWEAVRLLSENYLRRDPLQETVAAAAIRADLASGRPSAAQRRYLAIRQALSDELGVAPGADLERAIQGASPAETRGPAPSPDPAPRPAERVAGNLVPSSEVLLGRAGDIAAVGDYLERFQLVSLVGPGGVGKTRLLRALGESLQSQFTDGVWFVELAAIPIDGKPVEAIAAALQLDLGPVATEAALAERLRRRRCLLMLDNCEHLVAPLAKVLAAIVAVAPEVKLAASSQEPFQLSFEQVYRVEPLSDVAGAELFEAHLARLDPTWTANTQTRARIAAMVRLLDGMPLAIEMAAAWVPALGLDQVSALLTKRLDLLTARRRDGEARHKTLRSTLEWSHKLLDETEARTFRRLAVFNGDFTLEAVAALLSEEPVALMTAMEVMTNLVAKSLVTAQSRDGKVRYRLFSTVRLFAQEQLLAAGEAQVIRIRHTEWLADITAAAWVEFAGSCSDVEFAARYTVELDNIRGVIDWAYGEGNAPGLGDTLLATIGFFLPEPYLLRLQSGLTARLALDPAAELAVASAAKGRILVFRAHNFMRMKPDLAVAAADAALAALAGQQTDPWLEVSVLSSKGLALWSLGQLDEAETVAQDQITRTPPGTSSRIAAQACGFRAMLASARGQTEAMLRLFDEAIEQLKAIGADGLASFWRMTALQYTFGEDHGAAIDAWEDLLAHIEPHQMYADFVRSQSTIELAWHLAARAAPSDRDRLRELSSQFFRTSGSRERAQLCIAIAAAAQTDQPEQAARLMGHGLAASQAVLLPLDKRRVAGLSARLEASLTPGVLAALQAAGAALTSEHGAEIALAVLGPAMPPGQMAVAGSAER